MLRDETIATYAKDRRSRLKEALTLQSRMEHYGQRDVDHPIVCHACGFQERMPWSFGQQCPKCESEQFFPKLRVHISVTQWKRIGVCFGLIVFIICGIGYTASRVSPPTAQVIRTLICVNGNHVFQKEVDYNAPFPVSCDHRWHFGKTAHPAFMCDKGHIFPFDVAKLSEVGASQICPECQSSDVQMMRSQGL